MTISNGMCTNASQVLYDYYVPTSMNLLWRQHIAVRTAEYNFDYTPPIVKMPFSLHFDGAVCEKERAALQACSCCYRIVDMHGHHAVS